MPFCPFASSQGERVPCCLHHSNTDMAFFSVSHLPVSLSIVFFFLFSIVVSFFNLILFYNLILFLPFFLFFIFSSFSRFLPFLFTNTFARCLASVPSLHSTPIEHSPSTFPALFGPHLRSLRHPSVELNITSKHCIIFSLHPPPSILFPFRFCQPCHCTWPNCAFFASTSPLSAAVVAEGKPMAVLASLSITPKAHSSRVRKTPICSSVCWCGTARSRSHSLRYVLVDVMTARISWITLTCTSSRRERRDHAGTRRRGDEWRR